MIRHIVGSAFGEIYDRRDPSCRTCGAAPQRQRRVLLLQTVHAHSHCRAAGTLLSETYNQVMGQPALGGLFIRRR